VIVTPCNYVIAVATDEDPAGPLGRRPCRFEMGHEGRHMFEGQEELERLWADDEPGRYARWLQQQTKRVKP
jgi:hypothetical protein